jgi:simple sugar transport system ATP-binding protein
MTVKPESASQGRQPILSVEHASKAYGHVQALNDASLEIYEGEVLALVGDNGAGKSTMAKLISGEITADTGEIRYLDDEGAGSSVRESLRRGIEVVYQDLALAPDLSIAENMFLGREVRRSNLLGRLGATNRKQMVAQTREALDNLGVANLPRLQVSVSELSGGQQQAIAVARAVMWAKRLVVMDEPTAALGVKQTAMVYDAIAATAARGLSVLVISHDIPKMLTVADRIVVMRHGSVTAHVDSTSADLNQIIGLMLGETDQIRKTA